MINDPTIRHSAPCRHVESSIQKRPPGFFCEIFLYTQTVGTRNFGEVFIKVLHSLRAQAKKFFRQECLKVVEKICVFVYH